MMAMESAIGFAVSLSMQDEMLLGPYASCVLRALGLSCSPFILENKNNINLTL